MPLSLPPRLARALGRATPEQLADYWRDPGADNRPEGYLGPGTEQRSRLLLELIEAHLTVGEASVLEVGCNAGRNLAALFDAGCRDLTAIEVNADALALLAERFPELASTATIHNDLIETVAPTLADGGFDVVFSMAVLEHLHPDSEWVFAELARKSRRLVITIEDEGNRNWRAFPRNYRAVFEQLGFEQMEERDCGPADGFYAGIVARVFRRP